MDPVIIEPDAIKKRCRNKENHLRKFIQLILSVFSLGLLLSSPLWLIPSLSMLKEVSAGAFGSKGLFIICNVIIMFLVGESKLCKSSLQADIFEEYVNINKSNHKKTGRKENGEGEHGIEKIRSELLQEEEEEEAEEEEREKLEKGLDELTRRVEDFIARVNQQRKLEAKLLDCYG